MRENVQTEVSESILDDSNTISPVTSPSTGDNSNPNGETPSTKRKKTNNSDELNYLFLEAIRDISSQVSQISKDVENDDEKEDWHFLKSIQIKMKKMDENNKTMFKAQMLIQANEFVNKSMNK